MRSDWDMEDFYIEDLEDNDGFDGLWNEFAIEECGCERCSECLMLCESDFY